MIIMLYLAAIVVDWTGLGYYKTLLLVTFSFKKYKFKNLPPFFLFLHVMKIAAIKEQELFEYLIRMMMSGSHTSLKSKHDKNDFPKERTIYSESSQPGDFKNDLEIGLAT